MAVTTKKTFPATSNATTTTFTPVSIQLNNQDDLDVYVTLSGGSRVLQLRQSTGSTAQSSHPQVNNTDGLYFPAVTAGTTLYNYTLSTDNNTITFNSALPSGAVVSCERRTRDADSSYTTFASGSTIRATDLNNSSTESNFTAQDGRNKAFDLEGKLFDGPADGSIKTKLDGIEANATQDQTASEIRALVESASDSNVFTDADHSKLNAIEAGATADQTASEIKALYEDSGNSNASYIKTQYESNSNTNAYTDAEKTKLTGIETGATADQTAAEIRTLVESATDSNVFTDADHTKLNGIATGADVTSSNSINALTDVNTSGVADGKILKYDASSSAFIIADDGGGGGSGGSSTFTGLSDTPANFGSAAGKTLKVNSAGNAIEFATVGTDVVNDTTPQLGGNLDVQTNEITTSTTNGNVKLTPNGTGAVEVKGAGGNDGTLQLNCSQNSHGVKIKSPPHSASASYTLTLPTALSSSNAGHALKTDGLGQLSFGAVLGSNNEVIALFDQTSPVPVQRLLASGEGVTVQGTSAAVSKLMFRDRTTANFLKFKPVDTLSSDVEFTLPSADGSNGQFLKTNGSGVLSFASVNNQTLQFPSGATGVSCSTENEIQINSSNYKVVFDTDSTNTHEISFAGPSSLSKTSAYTLPEDGTNGQFLKTNGSGVLSFADVTSTYNIEINTLSSSSGSGGGSATFNGSATRFTLSNAGTNAQAHLVSVNGVIQKPNSGTSPSEGFAIDGNDIIFASAPATGSDFFILTLGNAINLSVPADNSVTSNKIVDGTIVNADIADDTISEAKLDIHAAPSGTDKVLGYTSNGMEWVESAAGATGGGTDKIFWENGQTVTTNYTITNGYNAMSAGPITINNGVAVTIGTGENWTIV